MKTNIILLGLCDDIVKKVGDKLANKFGLYYGDLEGIIDHHLQDENKIKEVCGEAYLKDLRDRCIDDICAYQNCILIIPPLLFVNADYLPKFKSSASLIVFINFSVKAKEDYYTEIKGSSEEDIKKILSSHEIVSNICKENSDIVVDVDDILGKAVYKKVKKAIEDYII